MLPRKVLINVGIDSFPVPTKMNWHVWPLLPTTPRTICFKGALEKEEMWMLGHCREVRQVEAVAAVDGHVPVKISSLEKSWPDEACWPSGWSFRHLSFLISWAFRSDAITGRSHGSPFPGLPSPGSHCPLVHVSMSTAAWTTAMMVAVRTKSLLPPLCWGVRSLSSSRNYLIFKTRLLLTSGHKKSWCGASPIGTSDQWVGCRRDPWRQRPSQSLC